MLAGFHNKPFPVCINRPVSVGCVSRGPCRGYVGNTSGTTGIILSVACGKVEKAGVIYKEQVARLPEADRIAVQQKEKKSIRWQGWVMGGPG